MGKLRCLLAGVYTKRGLPRDDEYRHVRLRQREKAGQRIEEYSRVLLRRLEADGFPEDDGIDFEENPGLRQELVEEPVKGA